LTHNLLTLGTQYNDTVQAAQKADRIVQAKVNNWGKAIAMLSRPASEIQAHLPHIQQDDPQYASLTELLAQLRDRLQKLETDAAQSLAMQHHLTVFAESDDISHTLLVKANELTKGSPIVKLEPEQFSAEFELHLSAYQPYQDQIKQHIHTQADLLNAIQDLYAQFSLLVVNKSVLVKREKAITNLESAFIKFKEIRTNLVEGIKVR
jgi:programmed cell death 6-interacting protein